MNILDEEKAQGMYDLICLSHLRWDFVYQRPQHLMSRFAARGRVFFVEEPAAATGKRASLKYSRRKCGVQVVTPQIPNNTPDVEGVVGKLIEKMIERHQLQSYCLWYYTPMATGWTRRLSPAVTVYDCMDELSAFKNAPAELKSREIELLRRADLVFTGGRSLHEAKRQQHASVYSFPSSIDAAHFAHARRPGEDPADQRDIPHIRLGYAGVIDERMDLDLIAAVADARPDWHLVMLGPVVKIPEASLPTRPNIHYLGMKSYEQLPAYLAGWDAAMLPFARNESTRFISPTKTPEYLAAGKPVVSTSIRDVVHPYGEAGVVHIADDPKAFVTAVQRALAEDPQRRLKIVDSLLAHNCWTRTWTRMSELIDDVVDGRTRRLSESQPSLPLAALAPGFGRPLSR